MGPENISRWQKRWSQKLLATVSALAPSTSLASDVTDEANGRARHWAKGMAGAVRLQPRSWAWPGSWGLSDSGAILGCQTSKNRRSRRARSREEPCVNPEAWKWRSCRTQEFHLYRYDLRGWTGERMSVLLPTGIHGVVCVAERCAEVWDLQIGRRPKMSPQSYVHHHTWTGAVFEMRRVKGCDKLERGTEA